MDEIKVDSSRGLIIDKVPEDYEFGASPLNQKRKVLVSDGQWEEYLPETYELQRNSHFDSFGCVSYSHQNAIEILHKRVYGYEIDWDDRDLVVGSGTKPNHGNGIKTVAEWARKNGLLKDKGDIPSTMSQEEYYGWKRSPGDDYEAEGFLELMELGYEWLPTTNWGQSYSSPEQLMEALLYSPIQASVDGNYQYNEDGTIGRLLNWSHEIVIIGYVKNRYWLVYDSEATQVLKFEWFYKFGYGMAHYLSKRNMKIVKKKNSPAIYFVNPADNKLVAYANGRITGGDMFKILFGDYKYAPIITLSDEEFAKYEIADYQMTTK
jgi:hypothetical protein